MSNTYDPCEPYSVVPLCDMLGLATYCVADRDGRVVAVFSTRAAADRYISSQATLAKYKEATELGRDFGRGL